MRVGRPWVFHCGLPSIAGPIPVRSWRTAFSNCGGGQLLYRFLSQKGNSISSIYYALLFRIGYFLAVIEGFSLGLSGLNPVELSGMQN